MVRMFASVKLKFLSHSYLKIFRYLKSNGRVEPTPQLGLHPKKRDVQYLVGRKGLIYWELRTDTEKRPNMRKGSVNKPRNSMQNIFLSMIVPNYI